MASHYTYDAMVREKARRQGLDEEENIKKFMYGFKMWKEQVRFTREL